MQATIGRRSHSERSRAFARLEKGRRGGQTRHVRGGRARERKRNLLTMCTRRVGQGTQRSVSFKYTEKTERYSGVQHSGGASDWSVC